MVFDDLVESFAKKAPVALLLRGLLDYAFADKLMTAIFEDNSISTYTRNIEFSHLVFLLTDVVFRVHPSTRAAYRSNDALQGVATLKSFYEKLNHTEPSVCAAFLECTAARVRPLIPAAALQPEPLPGLRLFYLDGNHLAATQRRLDGLEEVPSPLPGQALVLLEHATGLMTRVLPWEDGHSNERALLSRVIPWFGKGDCVIADCNFCTEGFFRGVIKQEAFFIVRHHGSVGLHPVGERVYVGKSPTGEVYEYKALYAQTNLEVRVVEVELNEETREGETVIRVLTNLLAEQAGAKLIADLYLQRRKIENVFQELEQGLESEVDTLAYPKAALLCFCIAAGVYNLVQVVRMLVEERRLEQKKANPKTPDLSVTLLAQEVRAFLGGLSIALEESPGMPQGDWTPFQMQQWLQTIQTHISIKKYGKSTRTPKRPRPTPFEMPKDHHGATSRILDHRNRAKRISTAPPLSSF